MRWPWRRRNGSARKARADAEAQLRAAKQATPLVERLADRMSEMPADEFAHLVAEAFGRRHR
jgi:hypothetical protein